MNIDVKNYEGIYYIDINTEKIYSYDRVVKCKTGHRKIIGKEIKSYVKRNKLYIKLYKNGIQKTRKLVDVINESIINIFYYGDVV